MSKTIFFFVNCHHLHLLLLILFYPILKEVIQQDYGKSIGTELSLDYMGTLRTHMDLREVTLSDNFDERQNLNPWPLTPQDMWWPTTLELVGCEQDNKRGCFLVWIQFIFSYLVDSLLLAQGWCTLFYTIFYKQFIWTTTLRVNCERVQMRFKLPIWQC